MELFGKFVSCDLTSRPSTVCGDNSTLPCRSESSGLANRRCIGGTWEAPDLRGCNNILLQVLASQVSNSSASSIIVDLANVTSTASSLGALDVLVATEMMTLATRSASNVTSSDLNAYVTAFSQVGRLS
jgi:hypothetical protein